MRRLYPILQWLTGTIVVGVVVGVVGSYVYDWLNNATSSAAHWQLIIDYWPWLAAILTTLLALTVWGYFADKKYRAREAAKLAEAKSPVAVSQRIENSPNSQQANAPGKGNVLVQASGEAKVTVTVNKEPASDRLVPMQIAPPPPDFTGREEELRELVDAVRKGGTTISALRGMGGIGKTALAQKIAQILKPDFPGGQVYLDLKGAKHEEDDNQSVQPLTASEALGRVIVSFGHEVNVNATVDERAALYRSILANTHALLLMDNARDEKQVKPLMPPEGPVLIVTSRQNFTLPGLFAKNLDTLRPDQACKLLLTIESRIGDDAARIAKLCGYLPLALRTTASTLHILKDLSPAEFLDKMKDAESRLHETGVKLAFTTGSELLDPALRDRWFQLAVFPGSFDPAGAAAIWQCDTQAAKNALSDLFRYSLIEWNSMTSRYRLHDLARDFTTVQLDESMRITAQGRHATYYKEAVATADQKYLSGGASLLEGLALFDLEWSNIQAGQAWAAAHSERDRSAAQLCAVYPLVGLNVLSLRQPPRERIKWLEAALISARKLADRGHEEAALGNLGLAYYYLGEYRRAIEFYEQQLAISRAIGDRRGEGIALGNRGIAYYALGEYRRAIEFCEQHLAIVREIGDRRGEGTALGNLGVAYYGLGEHRRAIESYEKHLAIAREIGDRLGEGNALGNRGLAYYSLSDYRLAIESYEQDLAITREIGDRLGEGNALGNRGLAYYSLGDYRLAIESYEQHLAIAREIGDRRGEGSALGNLGSAYQSLGEYRRAIEFYEQQLAIAREIGDRLGEGNALWNSALALDTLGDRAEAIRRAEQALSILEQIESPEAEKVRKQLAAWRKPS